LSKKKKIEEKQQKIKINLLIELLNPKGKKKLHNENKYNFFLSFFIFVWVYYTTRQEKDLITENFWNIS
jgi:hypothetical protein